MLSGGLVALPGVRSAELEHPKCAFRSGPRHPLIVIPIRDVLCVVALMWSQHSHPCIVMGVCRVLYVLGWLRARMRALRTPRRTPDGVPPSCASLALSVAHSIDSSFLGVTCETPTRPKHAQRGHTHVEASTYNSNPPRPPPAPHGTIEWLRGPLLSTYACRARRSGPAPPPLEPPSTSGYVRGAGSMA